MDKMAEPDVLDGRNVDPHPIKGELPAEPLLDQWNDLLRLLVLPVLICFITLDLLNQITSCERCSHPVPTFGQVSGT